MHDANAAEAAPDSRVQERGQYVPCRVPVHVVQVDSIFDAEMSAPQPPQQSGRAPVAQKGQLLAGFQPGQRFRFEQQFVEHPAFVRQALCRDRLRTGPAGRVPVVGPEGAHIRHGFPEESLVGAGLFTRFHFRTRQ